MELNHPNYGLAKSQEETILEDEVKNPLPRAVSRQNSYLLLDGEWKFSIDTDDKGLHEGWHIGHSYMHTASWPGSIEEHMEAAKGIKGWQDKIVARYEREFVLPEEANPLSNVMWQLTFGACGYETRGMAEWQAH